MTFCPTHSLDVWLTTLRDQEGYDAAKDTVSDWLDCLAEMASAGLDVAHLTQDIYHSANRCNIAISMSSPNGSRQG
jgi:uncharacterized protein YcbX